MDLISIVNNPNATIVDVRETYEFQYGHAANAINIPLSSLAARVDEFRKMKAPIVVYCQSGNRSGQARQFLTANGIQAVYNGGGLGDMNYYQSLRSKAA
ncbi:MAG: rhodanese-like domain-containing protein [Bacteroidetes bacterium]|nr:rhodanese-like domain-containing protein [Bacteroidota bacterium]